MQRMSQTAEIVGLAFESGYRHIDTAQGYGNERGVGLAIAASGIPRDELYITTKLGNAFHKPDDVRRSFEESLTKLGLDQLDLFLIHWPLPTLYDGDFVSTWKAMARLGCSPHLRRRLTRATGGPMFRPCPIKIRVERRPARIWPRPRPMPTTRRSRPSW